MTSFFSSSQKLPCSVSSVEMSPGSRVTMLGRTYHKAALIEDVKKVECCVFLGRHRSFLNAFSRRRCKKVFSRIFRSAGSNLTLRIYY